MPSRKTVTELFEAILDRMKNMLPFTIDFLTLITEQPIKGNYAAAKFTKSRTLLITHYLHAEHIEWSMTNQYYINIIYTHHVTITAFLKLFLIITAAFV